jgi:hypothetical protein
MASTSEAQGKSALQGAEPLRAKLVRYALYNAPFVLALVALPVLPDLLKALLVGAVLFLSPGLAWVDRRGRDGFVVVFGMVVASLLAALAAWLVLLPLPGPTSRVAYVLVLAAITNLGLFWGHKKGWYDPAPFRAPVFRAVLLVTAIFYAQSYLGAAYFVPALEDQDMETQGTAYGLIHEASPTMTTNRGTRFFFAHPLLLHFYIGAGCLISDDLDRLRHYHEGSLELADTSARPLDEVVWTRTWARYRVDLALFEKDPVLLPTRAPNLFLGVLVLFPLGFLIYRLGGSLLVTAGSCLLYATLPEVYVRTSYGGYMGMTNLFTLSAGYFYLQGAGLLPDRDGGENLSAIQRRVFGAGFLGAWSDQKVMLIPGAAGAHAGLRLLLDGGFKDLVQRMRSNKILITAIVLALGFVLGWALFAAYGFLVSPKDFVLDHIKNHILRRLRMRDLNLVGVAKGDWVYPSIVGLWQQFWSHTGWVLLAATLAALVRGARRLREAEGFFLIWLVVGGVGFSLVDWRQTKHLALLIPPLIVLVGAFWGAQTGKLRTLWTAVIAAALLVNLWQTGHEMANFNYIVPLPIW